MPCALYLSGFQAFLGKWVSVLRKNVFYFFVISRRIIIFAAISHRNQLGGVSAENVSPNKIVIQIEERT